MESIGKKKNAMTPRSIKRKKGIKGLLQGEGREGSRSFEGQGAMKGKRDLYGKNLAEGSEAERTFRGKERGNRIRKIGKKTERPNSYGKNGARPKGKKIVERSLAKEKK